MNFSEGILEIIENYKNKYTGSLEEYLIGIFRTIDDFRDNNLTYEIALQIIEEAFNKTIKIEEWNGEHELQQDYERMQKEYDDEAIEYNISEEIYDLKCKLVKYINEIRTYKGLEKNSEDINFLSKKKIRISTPRALKRNDPFYFLKRVALWYRNYLGKRIVITKESIEVTDDIHEKKSRVQDSSLIDEEGWFNFEILIEKGVSYKKKIDIPTIVLKIIILTVSAWIVVPQALKDELLSTERVIKYFSMIIFIYSIICIIFSIIIGDGIKKSSRKFKFNIFELIAYITIIIVGFII
ncbi:hypothetical protein [Oceanirhabdus seepicola]|uniref:Uncharacterized protein n=1 Tax=Oceanirhabdus seepicola TaxID=2828781 RepID=A0A9J6P1K4_9CLOT|nr:hypothetical protein [Oceanirhabdus seepicola]MCM1989921.1 hypothetical protein [Oceanirhabdus seepicola]